MKTSPAVLVIALGMLLGGCRTIRDPDWMFCFSRATFEACPDPVTWSPGTESDVYVLAFLYGAPLAVDLLLLPITCTHDVTVSRHRSE